MPTISSASLKDWLKWFSSSDENTKLGTVEYPTCIPDEYSVPPKCQVSPAPSPDYSPSPSPSPTPIPTPTPFVISDPKCKERYDKLYQDGTINSTLALGYGDSGGRTEDLVWSEYWGNFMIEKLTSECPVTYGIDKANPAGEQKKEIKTCGDEQSYKQSCGFKRSDDQEYLEKTIADPRLNGKQTTIRIRVVASAIGPSDKFNRQTVKDFITDRICNVGAEKEKKKCLKQTTPENLSESMVTSKCLPEDRTIYQPCKSMYARNAWLSAIENGDEMVIYDGHARDGGGPSFEIPQTLRNGHVNYDWYHQHRPGHILETAAFKKANLPGKKPPVFYSSHSCNSKRHFLKNGSFPECSPSTAFVLSDRTAYADESIVSLLQTFENVLSLKCDKDFSKGLKSASCSFNLHNF